MVAFRQHSWCRSRVGQVSLAEQCQCCSAASRQWRWAWVGLEESTSGLRRSLLVHALNSCSAPHCMGPPEVGMVEGTKGWHRVAESGLGAWNGTEIRLWDLFLPQVLQIDRWTDDPPAGEPLDSPAGIPRRGQLPLPLGAVPHPLPAQPHQPRTALSPPHAPVPRLHAASVQRGHALLHARGRPRRAGGCRARPRLLALAPHCSRRRCSDRCRGVELNRVLRLGWLIPLAGGQQLGKLHVGNSGGRVLSRAGTRPAAHRRWVWFGGCRVFATGAEGPALGAALTGRH